MKKLYIVLLFILLLSGFSVSASTLDLENSSYNEKVKFNFDYGVPIIKATIDDKEYNFLFDTGMPTTLSSELSKELQLKTVRTATGVDVNRNSSQEEYVTLDEIKIGGISFKNIEALSINLNAGFEIGCLQIDGVIGNNLIKDAIWEIDYESKTISLTDDIKNFQIPESASLIKFTMNDKRGYYSPNVDVKINNKKQQGVKFDTGSSGGFKMPLTSFVKILNPDKSVEYFGRATAALYGKGENQKYVDSKVESVEIGDLELSNQIINLSTDFATLGNRFFESYKVVIDYSHKKIYMIEQKEAGNQVVDNFGFQTSVVDGKAIVAIIYKKSDAETQGIQLGDEILKINNLDVEELIAADACGFLLNNPLKEIDKAEIIVLRNGNQMSFVLDKETLIE